MDSDRAVHLFSASGKVLILAGGGVIEADDTVLVPVLDDGDGTPFTGDCALGAKDAWGAVKGCLRHGAVEDLVEWQEL